MINPGDLVDEITIQTGLEVRAPNGEISYDYTHPTFEAHVWAQWLPTKPTEQYRDAARQASYVAGFFRTWNNLSPRPTPYNTRILFDGYVYDIAPVMIVGDGDGIDIPVIARGE